MLIRSQDGYIIANFENTLLLRADALAGNKSCYAIKMLTGEYKQCFLGVYESGERCKEIISDICDQYTEYAMYPGAGGNAVFQMPEE